ncbi:M14 family metallopeptidase [Mastigocoleus testarum]|uniref:Carboxypeptidase n=1 Tax=Mastigocoleus testarum BC008 TaxID=371196 RepID=A0A0V7ZD11_9CYAN|nr:M14 family metallopeptidase [Mastigocoleus testarum]KST62347.1 carboxypeptidase [Mastigocoleus testarum BC008]KST63123.1 carboxypeptidase [Mastigocoleus testarum BC008]
MKVNKFDFSHYYTYAELVDYLTQMAEDYPKLIDLQVLGKSYAGRDIWLVTLTNQVTGSPLTKPGYWIDANTHAAEVTGSAVACYTIYYLLTQYHRDPQATNLLDNYTVYVLPRLAIDGAEKYLTTPYWLRSSVRPYPYPEKQDGLHWEDINGDGLILLMRIQDECGAWKVSEEDPRLMVDREPEEFGGTYYTLLPEGFIHNYDGKNIKVAPRLEGMDFNRNYPYLWMPEGVQKGAGDLPLSESETRSEAEFWQSHRNINGFISYHTHCALILRPYSTHPDEHFPVEDLEIYKLIGEKGSKLTGYECVSVYHDFRRHPQQVTNGGMDDYGYDHFGWFGFTIELWDAPTAAGVNKGKHIDWSRRHPVADDLKLLQWNDQKLAGKGFINWEPFNHPQLGEVEIGGWDDKLVWDNAPPEYLPDICNRQCRFAIAHALMSPRLVLGRADAIYQGSDIYHVMIQLENQGFLPTYTSQKALERGAVKPIEVNLSLPSGVSLVSGQLKQNINHLEGRSNKVTKLWAKQGTDYRCHVEWVIKGASGSEIEITAVGERSGMVSCRLRLEPSKVKL